MLAVYRDVWDDFYQWEEAYCSRLIVESTAATSARPVDADYMIGGTGADDVNVENEDVDRLGPVFTVCEWNEAGELSKARMSARAGIRKSRRTRTRNLVFWDHPTYESCTPINSYIFSNETPSLAACPFVKYGDSPSFNVRAYLWKFHSLEWQDKWRDPDCECTVTSSPIAASNELHGAGFLIAATAVKRLTARANEDDGELPLTIYCDDIDNIQCFGPPVDDVLHHMQARYVS
jgi:hypothetical protein